MGDPDIYADVFSLDELAQATGASPSTLQALVDSGRLPVVPGTVFVRGRDAVAIGRWLRDHDEREPFGLSSALQSGRHGGEPGRLARMSSAGAHVVAAGLLLWTSGPRIDATVEEPPTRTRLVFVVDPGRGSSGGGGTPSRPRPETRKRPEPPPAPPKAIPPPPLEATSFAAPVLSSMPATPSRVSTEEALDKTKRDPALADGAGPGTTGGVGTTSRSGIGEGNGPGEGGAGYGSGRGVSPPRLLHEVKAVYTEDARRQGITGEVVLSIVIEADGHVGNVRLVRGLGAGLDERAIAAVREWQFAPAKRLGTPVAVTVEAVVQFNLR